VGRDIAEAARAGVVEGATKRDGLCKIAADYASQAITSL